MIFIVPRGSGEQGFDEHGRNFQGLMQSYCFKWEVASEFPSMDFLLMLFLLDGGFFEFYSDLQFSRKASHIYNFV